MLGIPSLVFSFDREWKGSLISPDTLPKVKWAKTNGFTFNTVLSVSSIRAGLRHSI